MTTFGEAVCNRRKQLGLSQEQLAIASGLHRTHISLIERGLRDPRLETLVKLGRALRATPAEMISWYTPNNQRKRTRRDRR